MTNAHNRPADAVAYQAKNILTMNPAQPFATHVAVSEGKILAVGDADSMKAWGITDFDTRYKDQVLMPGLIEGHCHLHEGVVWRYVYVGYYSRKGPDGTEWSGLTSIEAVIERLKEHQEK